MCSLISEESLNVWWVMRAAACGEQCRERDNELGVVPWPVFGLHSIRTETSDLIKHPILEPSLIITMFSSRIPTHREHKVAGTFH